MKIKIKRVYEKSDASDGYRILIDRLWPRGITKEKANIDLWLKNVAPSTTLRKWFDHDPAKWNDFLSRYKDELAYLEEFTALKTILSKHKVATLLYGAKDTAHNNAVAVLSFLNQGL